MNIHDASYPELDYLLNYFRPVYDHYFPVPSNVHSIPFVSLVTFPDNVIYFSIY